jgi:1-deoxy-D-xylulose-5-phosphate reductoisomerase
MAMSEAALPLAHASSGRRTVSILGATGSVGRSTTDLLMRHRDRYEVVALTANRDADGLIALARELRPRLAVIADPAGYAAVHAGLAGTGTAVAAGADAVVEAATRPVDWVMAAIVGMAGLAPTMAAIRTGATVAFASKECLVAAGPVMMAAIRRHGATLLPVDSEHNAIFQVFDFARPEAVERIILTASGGPFRQVPRESLAAVTPEQAVAHPNWRMGAKISVDSATMMNKGLEVIEAHHLFAMPGPRIEVVIHPQSIVHSLVAYVDGSVLAQLGSPDMRTPIAHTLAWPDRIQAPSPRLDLAAIGTLSFEAPDDRAVPGARPLPPGDGGRRRHAGGAERRQRDRGRGLPGARHRLPRHPGHRRGNPGARVRRRPRLDRRRGRARCRGTARDDGARRRPRGQGRHLTARFVTVPGRRPHEMRATVWSIGSLILILMIARTLPAAVGA